jgi:cytochrome c
MHRRFPLLGLALIGMFIVLLARAGEPATPDEAKALAEKAAAHMREVGPDQAIADFNRPDGGYVDRELFVVVYGPDNTIRTSIGVPVLLGKDATKLKDVEGKPFGQEIIDTAKTKGSGWVEYRMTNAATHKVAEKNSWVIRVGDYIVFVGAYKT